MTEDCEKAAEWDVEWHEAKRLSNLAKRGVDFEDAVAIWLGPVANRRSDQASEIRYVPVGRIDSRVVVIVWTPRSGARRLISARMASSHERQCYTAFVERARQGRH